MNGDGTFGRVTLTQFPVVTESVYHRPPAVSRAAAMVPLRLTSVKSRDPISTDCQDPTEMSEVKYKLPFELSPRTPAPLRDICCKSGAGIVSEALLATSDTNTTSPEPSIPAMDDPDMETPTMKLEFTYEKVGVASVRLLL